MTSNKSTREKLVKLRAESKTGGGPAKINRQHRNGKLTARERIALLLDEGSFEELDAFVTNNARMQVSNPVSSFVADSVVTGYGEINGRLTYVFAQDFTVFGGSLSETAGGKICKIMDLSLKNGAPIVGLIDSGGARIQEGVDSLAAYGDIFLRNTLASGVVPQITVIMGPAAGGSVYSPALTDFTFMIKESAYMYITGPDVLKTVTQEEITHKDLGGTEIHVSQSGVAHFSSPSEQECLEQVRRLLDFLPQNNLSDPDVLEMDDEPQNLDGLANILPNNPNQPYDMNDILLKIIDEEDLMEIHQDFAKNIIVGFARIQGHSIGIVAQQPLYLSGALDIDASLKAARFVRFCDAFNIPIVTFIDVPGFLPGSAQESSGIIKNGAKLIYAYAEATVPKISVITRKAYGGAYIVMSSKHLRGDINYAWPNAEIAVMGPEGAVSIVNKQALKDSSDPIKLKKELTEKYRSTFASPYVAASRGYLDDIIDPSETRYKIIKALYMLNNKRDTLPTKKHGNIPL